MNKKKKIKIAVIVTISAVLVILALIYLFTLHDYRIISKSDYNRRNNGNAMSTRMNYYECVMSLKGVTGDSGATVIYTNYVTGEEKKINYGPDEEIDEKIEIGDMKKHRDEVAFCITVEGLDSSASISVEIIGRPYGIDLIEYFLHEYFNFF